MANEFKHLLGHVRTDPRLFLWVKVTYILSRYTNAILLVGFVIVKVDVGRSLIMTDSKGGVGRSLMVIDRKGCI